MMRALHAVLVVTLSIRAAATGAELEEYRIKALFLYNFTQFVEWPEQAFKDSAAPLQICVLGVDPFERGELAAAIDGKSIEHHKLASRHIGDLSQAAGCHIVFVSANAFKRARPFLSEHKQAGLLTVGENPGFAANGGVVNLVLKDGKVRLEINVGAADKEGLRISAKLLKLAEIIK